MISSFLFAYLFVLFGSVHKNLELSNTAFISLLTINLKSLNYFNLLLCQDMGLDCTWLQLEWEKETVLLLERVFRTTQKLLLSEALFFRVSSMWGFVKVLYPCLEIILHMDALGHLKKPDSDQCTNKYHKARVHDGQQPFCLGLELFLIPVSQKALTLWFQCSPCHMFIVF